MSDSCLKEGIMRIQDYTSVEFKINCQELENREEQLVDQFAIVNKLVHFAIFSRTKCQT